MAEARGKQGLFAARPFPGLRPFAYEDHAYFFGREEQTYALYGLLEISQFLAVVGNSGSGKSSLVRAGLLPLLESENKEMAARDGPDRGRMWRWVEMRPGDAPLGRLAEALAGLGAADDGIERAALRERLDNALRRGSFGMSEAVAEIDGLDDCSLLILVDQFEELFRYGAGGAAHARLQEERDQFVQLLLAATSGSDRQVHVLITMRSDFIGDCAQFYGLPEAVSTCQFLVPSLTREQREEVIRRPLDADRADGAIDSGLVERLLNDAGSDADQLPVLQHCLSRLWDVAGPSLAAPPHRRLTLDHYAQVGRIAEALSQHADEILADLNVDQVAVEQVFRALSEVDREGRATRRALRYANLRAETGIDDDVLRPVVDRFRDDDCSFLVPPISALPVVSDDTIIDIGHEALLRRWAKIGAEAHETLDEEDETGWLEAEANDARDYRMMVRLAGPNPHATLPLDRVDRLLERWRGRPRTEAWANRYGGHVDRVERLFANTLKARRRRRLGFASVAGVILLLAAGVAAGAIGYWYQENQRKLELAQTQQREAEKALQQRGVLLRELAEVTQEISTDLRFLPGTNKSIVKLLDQVEDFSGKFSELLRTQVQLLPGDRRVEAELEFPVKILRADYQINFGKVGAAIDILNKAEADLKAVPRDEGDRAGSLAMLDADIHMHRASAETLYGAKADARRDFQEAETIYRKLVTPDASETASDDSGPSGALDDREKSAERLASLYRSRLFLDSQFFGDADAAAKDLATLDKLIAEQLSAHRSEEDQSQKYWLAQEKRLVGLRADLAMVRGDIAEAVRLYGKLTSETPPSGVTAELYDAFLKYKLGAALVKSDSASDIEKGIHWLSIADEVYGSYSERDPGNSWWPLVRTWSERALAKAYLKQKRPVEALNIYARLIYLDQWLADQDKGNPRAQQDLALDTKAKAEAAANK